MVRTVVAGIIGLLLFAALTGRAEAKNSVGFTITGGDLGDYAATVSAPMPDGPYLPIGIPIDQTLPATAPDPRPALAYDFHLGWYGAADGPAYRYYPDVRLLHDVDYTRWLELLPESASLLDDRIAQALATLERGELERGVAASWLRYTRMEEAQYWLRPYGPLSPSSHPVPSRGSCGQCTPKISDVEAFVMQHLVQVVSEQTVRSAERTPRFFIEFEWWDGQSGFGGLLGLYDPPSNGQLGLFWPHGPEAGQRAYETTPGFDAAIVDALARQGTAAEPAPEQVEDADSEPGFDTAIADALARRDERGVAEQAQVSETESSVWPVPVLGAIAAFGTVAIAAGAVRLRPLAGSRR